MRRETRNRLFWIVPVLAVHIGIAAMLAAGLTVSQVQEAVASILVTDIEAPPPAPPEEEARAAPEPEGEDAPPDLVADAVPVVAPPPEIELAAPPPPVVAAPAPSDGRESDAGAAQVEGPGTGLAGTGTGRGAGGDGMGGGGTRAELVSGEIRNRDYPRAARKARAEGVVEVNYDVGPDGRVRNCRVTLSSGNAELDMTTCRLIEDRFRYEPARDGRGEATTDVTGWRQTWWFEGR